MAQLTACLGSWGAWATCSDAFNTQSRTFTVSNAATFRAQTDSDENKCHVQLSNSTTLSYRSSELPGSGATWTMTEERFCQGANLVDLATLNGTTTTTTSAPGSAASGSGNSSAVGSSGSTGGSGGSTAKKKKKKTSTTSSDDAQEKQLMLIALVAVIGVLIAAAGCMLTNCCGMGGQPGGRMVGGGGNGNFQPIAPNYRPANGAFDN